MSLFGKKKAAAADNSRRKQQLVLFSNSEHSVYLAFGLNWVPIVSESGRSTELKRAKARGATHQTSAQQLMGYGTIAEKKLVDVKIFPAAQVVARQHGGDAIHVLKFDDSEYWICVIRNGTPQSIDKVVHSNEAEVVKEVHDLLEAGAQNGTKYAVYTNLEFADFEGSQHSDIEEIFLATGVDADLLLPIPRGSLSIPAPLIVLVAIVGIAVAGQQAYRWKQRDDARKAAALAALDNNEPSAVAWGRVIKNWENSNTAPSMEGLTAARASIGQVPIVWKGWKLKTTTCKAGKPLGVPAPLLTASAPAPTPTVAPAITRIWSCNANYERSSIGATNEEMVAVMPQGWSATFAPMSKMTTNWTLTESIQVVNIADLETPTKHLVDTSSILQRVSGTFMSDVPLVFKPVVFPPPIRTDKKPYPPDPNTPEVLTAPIKIATPIRGVDVITQKDLPISWDTLTLQVGGFDGLNNSALRASPLRAEILGTIYAKTK